MLRHRSSFEHRLRDMLILCALVAAIAALPARAHAEEFSTVGLYRSFDQTYAWAQQLAADNSDIVKLVEFGRSWEDRPLFALQLTQNAGVNNSSKPEFLISAGLHAREVVTSEAACRLAQQLVEDFRSGQSQALETLCEREVWIVPQANPDGRLWVESGRSDHRKNRHLYPGQSQSSYTCGVDLNRNFPYRWSLNTASAASNMYAGPAALSENESAALWSLLHNTQYFDNLLGAIDLHSGYQSVLLPEWHPSDQLPISEMLKLLGLQSQLAFACGLGTTDVAYDYYGSLHQSLYDEFGTYAFCMEIFEGDSSEYFDWFNPTSQQQLDATINQALAGMNFFLSDEAFAIVPEPMTLAILLGGVCALARRRQSHI